MAELMQLDKAAELAGKSEVTIRRLIKAGKIPFQKTKTLTGFVYMVNPDKIQEYYGKEPLPATEENEAAPAAVSTLPSSPRVEPIRLAVAGENGSAHDYWQKKSDMYEDKYHVEVSAHAKTREDLGVWRGRAEQSQAMLMKLLPAPGSVEVRSNQPAPVEKNTQNVISWATLGILLILLVLVLVGVGVILFLRGSLK